MYTQVERLILHTETGFSGIRDEKITPLVRVEPWDNGKVRFIMYGAYTFDTLVLEEKNLDVIFNTWVEIRRKEGYHAFSVHQKPSYHIERIHCYKDSPLHGVTILPVQQGVIRTKLTLSDYDSMDRLMRAYFDLRRGKVRLNGYIRNDGRFHPS